MVKKSRYRKPILKDIYGDSQFFNKETKKYSNNLLLSGQINDEFLAIMSTLKLEEVIALKLEETLNTYGGKYYGFSIWHSLPEIVKSAIFKYVSFCTNSRKEAIMLLGVDSRIYGQIEAKYKHNLESFEDENNEESLDSE